MFFTQEDYKKIQKWLLENSIKDTEMETSQPLDGRETIAIVQDNKNVRVGLKELLDQIMSIGVKDLINVSLDGTTYSLLDAVTKVPTSNRKRGLVLVFKDLENTWSIYQYIGNTPLTDWNVANNWLDILVTSGAIQYTPDNEDISSVVSPDNNIKYLKLSDREYNPEKFSGLARIILRKNIITMDDGSTKNVISEKDINADNTVFEIRYDYDLLGKTIKLGANSVLEFHGGSLNNGTINCRPETIIKGFNGTATINNLEYVDKFKLGQNITFDNSDNTINVDVPSMDFNIRKVYPTISAANAALPNPTDDNGEPIKYGELVAVTGDGYYILGKGEWIKQSGFNLDVVNVPGTSATKAISQDFATKHGIGKEFKSTLTEGGKTTQLKDTDASPLYPITKADAVYVNSKNLVNTLNEIPGEIVDLGENKHGEIFNDYELNTATGDYSHAEGSNQTVEAPFAHAEGSTNSVFSKASSGHAEGNDNTLSGPSAHVEGSTNNVDGYASHGEGYLVEVKGNYAHGEGHNTRTTNTAEHAQGQFNISNTGETDDLKTIHSVGVGTSDIDRKNAHEIMTNGDQYVFGIGDYDGTNSVTANDEGKKAKTIQEVVNSKLDTNNIKTINNESLLGAGNIETVGEKTADGGEVFNSAKMAKSDAHAEGGGSNNSCIEYVDDSFNGKPLKIASKDDILAEFAQQGGMSHSFAMAYGEFSHIEGTGNIALGEASHAEGAAGNVAGGYPGNIAYGDYSHVEGDNTFAEGNSAHAEGAYTKATSLSSHAEGISTIASAWGSHAEGNSTKAEGDFSHAEGAQTVATGNNSHSEGLAESGQVVNFSNNLKPDKVKSVSGNTFIPEDSRIWANYFYRRGRTLQIVGKMYKIVDMNSDTNTITVNRPCEFKAGDYIYYIYGIASGDQSHSEGKRNDASGKNSHAEGHLTYAVGDMSHTEGSNTTATGENAHAEGERTRAESKNSHVEGFNTVASKNNSHAEGQETIASGTSSHAEGYDTTADGDYSHAEGVETFASNYAQHTQGVNNVTDIDPSPNVIVGTKPSFVVGNGTGTNHYSHDSLRLLNNGNLYLQGVGGFTGGESWDGFPAANVKSIQESINKEVSISDKQPVDISNRLWMNPAEDDIDVELIPEAPKDGKEYVRKNGAWYLAYPEGGYIREQAETAGAVWHPESKAQDGTQGAYWLNGLKDMTIQQIAYSLREGSLWFRGNNMSGEHSFLSLRTNIPSDLQLFILRKIAVDGNNLFFGCKNLEVLFVSSLENPLIFSTCSNMLVGCSALRKILGSMQSNNWAYAFSGCVSLEEIRISGLKTNISIHDSSSLSVSDDANSSVGYMLINAIGGSPEKPITATFAKPVYDKIMKSDFLKSKAQEKHIIIAQAV